ncbi:MAG: VCBS repeat-containing protein, partial [Saprospiraceae bacterium]
MGTGGVVPELSINYSSLGGQSTLGLGWGLSGLSAISRSGNSNFYDSNVTPIEYTGDDRFGLDGNRMFVLAGTYGTAGSTYGFESENFGRVTAYGGTAGDPSYFIMETKDGIKYEYGKDYNSRYETGSGKAMIWYISKMIYPDGNYILYKYKNLHNLSGGGVLFEQVVDEINFTGNDIAGIVPYSTVKFYYQERTDDIIGYQKGTSINKSLVIGSIQISTDGMTVKSYDFTYGYRKSNTFLHQIKEKGADGASINVTHFQYGDEPSGNNTLLYNQSMSMDDDYFPCNLNGDGNTDLLFARRSSTHPGEHLYFAGTSNVNFSVNLTTSGRVVAVADFNGDNLDDVLELYFVSEVFGNSYASYRLKVHFNSDPNGALDYNENFVLNPSSSNPYEREHVNNDHIGPMHTGDFNGDGLADIFYVNGERLLIAYGQRSSSQPLSSWQFVTLNLTNPNTLNYLWGFDIEKLAIIDFNGDGKSDILVINGAQSAVFEFETNTKLKEIFFNNSGGFTIKNRLFDQEFLTYFGDFNGDGYTDVLVKTGDQNSDPWYINYSTGVGFNRTIFDFIRNPSIEQQDFDVYHGDIVSVGDYNG